MQSHGRILSYFLPGILCGRRAVEIGIPADVAVTVVAVLARMTAEAAPVDQCILVR